MARAAKVVQAPTTIGYKVYIGTILQADCETMEAVKACLAELAPVDIAKVAVVKLVSLPVTYDLTLDVEE